MHLLKSSLFLEFSLRGEGEETPRSGPAPTSRTGFSVTHALSDAVPDRDRALRQKGGEESQKMKIMTVEGQALYDFIVSQLDNERFNNTKTFNEWKKDHDIKDHIKTVLVAYKGVQNDMSMYYFNRLLTKVVDIRQKHANSDDEVDQVEFIRLAAKFRTSLHTMCLDKQYEILGI